MFLIYVIHFPLVTKGSFLTHTGSSASKFRLGKSAGGSVFAINSVEPNPQPLPSGAPILHRDLGWAAGQGEAFSCHVISSMPVFKNTSSRVQTRDLLGTDKLICQGERCSISRVESGRSRFCTSASRRFDRDDRPLEK